MFLINCYSDVICLDLGEPVKLFHIGYFSIENLMISNLTENIVTSEIDLHQCNNPAFELALDSPTVQLSKSEGDSNQTTNSLCFIFVSSITNKINLLQTDIILSYSKLKPLSAINYKCENVFSYSNKFSSKLNELFMNSFSDQDKDNEKKSEVLRQILYS